MMFWMLSFKKYKNPNWTFCLLEIVISIRSSYLA
jgi:hypothetical protein